MVTLVVFIFGTIVGSFIGVLVTRKLTSESALVGRSRCDLCHHQIAWYDNIPLLSYLILSGKCRYCHKPISIQHPAIELLFGALFVWWYLVGFAFFHLSGSLTYLQPAYWLITGLLLLFIALIDLKYYLIPDSAVVILILLSLIYRSTLILTGVMNPVDFTHALLSGLVLASLFAFVIFATKGKGMGWGDVKLAVVIGLIVGWPRIILSTFSAFVLGAAVGLVLIIAKKKRFGQTIPFGPFLIVGSLLGLIFGNQVWTWYMKFLF